MPSNDDRGPGPRDLIGYGLERPKVVWPKCAKLAVSIVVAYEEGAEYSVESGDPRNDHSGDLASSVPRDRRDLSMEQMFNYGTRAGAYRILESLTQHERKATFMFCGRACERTPELAAHIVQLGHEAACHGYRWCNHALFESEDLERSEIARATDSIEQITGSKPLGFYSRWGSSVNTRRLLQEMGYLYDSNAYDDDLPYYDQSLPGGPMLVLPYSLDTNDYRFVEGDPWGAPQAFLDYLVAATETLLEEGARGFPKMMSVGLHLRIIGRPARLWALQRWLENLDTFGSDLWVATRLEIARHWLENYPAGDRLLATP